MRPADNRSSRRTLSRALMLLGALLLLSIPGVIVVFAFAQATDAAIPGTWLILSAMAGMALVGVGAAIYD